MHRSDGTTRRIDEQKRYAVRRAHGEEYTRLVGHESVTAWWSVTGGLSRRTSRGSVDQIALTLAPRTGGRSVGPNGVRPGASAARPYRYPVDTRRVNLAEAGDRQSPQPQPVKKRLIR